jgi:type I restriction enzyme S subunit
VIIDSKQLPVGWSVLTIEEIADVNPRLNKAGIPDDLNVSFVPMAAVGAADGSVDVSGERLFGEVKKGFTPFQEGDVLFAKITPCMENGKMAIVPQVENGIGFGSTEFHVLRPKEGIDARYIYYYVSSKNFRGEAERYMSGAVGQKRVTTPYLKESEIPVAPPDQQKRIVAEIEKQFSRLDEAVANLKRVKANLKRYKAAVLKAAVEGRLVETEAELARRQGRDFGTGEQLLQRILKTRRSQWQGKGKYKEPAAPDMTGLPELPEGWVWASLDQLTKDSLIGLDRGRNQQNVDGIGVPYIKMNNVTMGGEVTGDDLVYVNASEEEKIKFRLERNDLLFNTRNSKELVGKVGLVGTLSKDSIYNNNLMRIRLANGVTPNFICSQMCSNSFRSRMELVKKATTNVAAVYAKDLFPLQLALTSVNEQHRIVTEVDRRLSLAREVEIQVETNLTRAERLRQSILQQAFTGRLVPPEPIGEPACRLLDGGQKGGKKKITNKESISP